AEMGKLNPPYTLNRSVQPEIFGRPTGFARQADAAGIFHTTHTFRPTLNYGAIYAADPLRPSHFRAVGPNFARLLNSDARADAAQHSIDNVTEELIMTF